MTPGILAVARREADRIRGSFYYPLLLVVLPVLSFALLLGIFRSGVPRDLPIAVVDDDHTSLSRQLTRMIDASPSIRVAWQVANLEEGRALVLEGRAYGVVVIPPDAERDVRRGEAPKVTGYYNAQLLLPASLIRRDLRSAIGTMSAGLEMRARESKGETPRAALAHVEPIRVDSHTLFNPQLNYVYFLVTALLPTMLQIFVSLATVHAVGVELKQSSAGGWLAAAGGSAWRAVVGKLLPYTLSFTLLALFMLALLFRILAVPFRGSVQVVVVSTVLFVLAYQVMAVLAVAWSANLRFASSLAAIYCAPAFAFVGITFPTMGMPVLGRTWAQLLPLTHYLRVLTDQALRGAPAATGLAPMAALLAFVLLAPLAAAPRLGRVLRESRYWGRL